MGNVHEVRQVEPVRTSGGGGAALRVRRPCHDSLRARQTRFEDIGPFHYALKAIGVKLVMPNVQATARDGAYEDEVLYFCIGSGYKLDYERYCEFVAVLHELAPFFEDALFYVNDEIFSCGFLDEFRIREGHLEYKRVVEAGCSDVDDYLEEKRFRAEGPPT
jgi:hypothetical protein